MRKPATKKRTTPEDTSKPKKGSRKPHKPTVDAYLRDPQERTKGIDEELAAAICTYNNTQHKNLRAVVLCDECGSPATIVYEGRVLCDSHYSRRFATASQGVPLQKPETKTPEPKSTKQQPVSVPDTKPYMRPLQVPKDNVYPGSKDAPIKVTQDHESEVFLQVAGHVYRLTTEGKELVIEDHTAFDYGRSMTVTPTSSTRIKLS